MGKVAIITLAATEIEMMIIFVVVAKKIDATTLEDVAAIAVEAVQDWQQIEFF